MTHSSPVAPARVSSADFSAQPQHPAESPSTWSGLPSCTSG
ncbi:unnamed protein product [Rhodiola kirilowii]